MEEATRSANRRPVVCPDCKATIWFRDADEDADAALAEALKWHSKEWCEKQQEASE